jgi:hypothetical protein
MKKIITIILLTFVVSITFAQQYTPMTAAGYQMKRLKVDSTLHIPSFCGVPTTRNSTAKEGAIAMDTCNNLLYKWTNASGWSTISGGGGSLGINGLNGTDSIKLGGPLTDNTLITGKYAFNMYGLDVIDLQADGNGEVYIDSNFVGIAGKIIQLESDSINTPSSDTSFYKPLAIGTSKNLRRMSSWPKTDTSSLSSRINLKLNIADTSAMLSKYLRKTDTASLSNRINLKLNLSDTATMLSKYLRKTDTASLSARINLKLNISDTATMLSKYLRKTDTASLSNRINLKLNISDTSAMLSKYLRKTDTASLSARINTKLAIADTVNKWVQDVTKLNDSTIRVRKNNTNTDIILPKGTGGGGTFTSPNLQQVLDSGNIAADKSITLGNSFDTSTIYTRLNLPTSVEGDNKILDMNLGDPNAGGYSRLSLGVNYPSGIIKPYIEGLSYINGGYPFKLTGDSLTFGNMSTNQNYLRLSTSNQVQLTLPTTTQERYLTASVNNNYADVNGNITISTGGQTGRFGNDTATVVMVKVHNDAGVTLTNGKVVALASSGNNNEAPAVRLANNKHDSTSANTLGFVVGSIANQDTGWVILSGKIEKLNTSAFSNGDIIYLDSTSGNITKTKPVAPYHMVYLGVVVKANAGNGAIFVKAQNGYELDEIHDVLITSKLNNQVLAYSDTQKVWKNRNIYSIVDTTNYVATKTNVATKLNISDTSTFQRKSISSYSIMANNTPSAANTTAQVFNDSSYKTYPSANITWTGGTAPTTLTTSTYSFTQIGKMVSLYILLVYSNSGSSPTSLTLQIPSDCPQPSSMGTTPAAGNFTFCTGLTFGRLNLTTQAVTFGQTSYMKRNAGNTAYEMFTPSTTGAFRVVSHSFYYKTD